MTEHERAADLAYWQQARRNRIEDRSEARSQREADRIEREIDAIDAKLAALQTDGAQI